MTVQGQDEIMLTLSNVPADKRLPQQYRFQLAPSPLPTNVLSVEMGEGGPSTSAAAGAGSSSSSSVVKREGAAEPVYKKPREWG